LAAIRHEVGIGTIIAILQEAGCRSGDISVPSTIRGIAG
jgi:hypothetical protein